MEEKTNKLHPVANSNAIIHIKPCLFLGSFAQLKKLLSKISSAIFERGEKKYFLGESLYPVPPFLPYPIRYSIILPPFVLTLSSHL